MRKQVLLGANIRALRIAHGETEEDLGAALDNGDDGVTGNAISNYEAGIRTPSLKKVTAIAKHYMITVDELLYHDWTSIERIAIENDGIWQGFDILFPIMASKEALKDEHFAKAYHTHRDIHKKLSSPDLSIRKKAFDNVELCIDAYFDAMYGAEESNNAEFKATANFVSIEATANFISLWFLFEFLVRINDFALDTNPPAVIAVLMKKDKGIKREIITHREESCSELDMSDDLGNELHEDTIDMISELKNHGDWKSDLADYFLALQYYLGIVNNELGYGFNRRIGIEMLNAFKSVGNVFSIILLNNL